MKEEALQLAKYLDRLNGYMDMPRDILDITQPSSAMIRRLVEELDKQQQGLIESSAMLFNYKNELDLERAMSAQLKEELDKKPLSDEEIEYYENLIAKLFNCSVTQKVVGLDRVIRAIEERHGIK